MAEASSRVERLRQCRLVFERATRDGISMTAARDALAHERWLAVSERRRVASCGTRDMGPAEAVEQRPKPWMMAE